MPSDLQVSNLKALDGTAGISIADSTGNITLNNPITTGTFNGTIGTSATPPAGSIVQHIQGIETSAWALASGGSDTNTQSITPRSYNTTNGYFVLEWFIEGYKDSTAGQGRASVEISYDGGTYSTVGKSFNYLTYIHPNGGTSPFGIMSQAVSRKTYLQGTLEHTFRLKILAQSGSFYVYADSHMWNIYEVYHP